MLGEWPNLREQFFSTVRMKWKPQCIILIFPTPGNCVGNKSDEMFWKKSTWVKIYTDLNMFEKLITSFIKHTAPDLKLSDACNYHSKRTFSFWYLKPFHRVQGLPTSSPGLVRVSLQWKSQWYASWLLNYSPPPKGNYLSFRRSRTL